MKSKNELSAAGFIGLLFVFLLQGSNTTLSPAIAAISAALDMEPGRVAQIGTVPAIFSVIAGFLAGRFAGRAVRYRTFIIVSLLITIAGGGSAVFFPSWPVILFSRACAGFGSGVYMALPPALVMKFYRGETRRARLGLANAAASSGGLLMMLSAGILADIKWNYVFGIYSIGIFGLILVITHLPEPPAEAEGRGSPPVPSGEAESRASPAPEKNARRIPLPVMLNFIMAALVSVFGLTALSFISTIISERGLGTGVHAGTAAIMFNISAVIFSFLFGPLYRTLKKYYAVAILASVCAGMVLTFNASSLVMAGAGMFLVGTYLLIIPALISDNANFLEPENMTLATSLLGAVINVGNFLMGPYIDLAIKASGGEVLAPLRYGIYGLAATAIIFLLIRMFEKNKAPPAA